MSSALSGGEVTRPPGSTHVSHVHNMRSATQVAGEHQMISKGVGPPYKTFDDMKAAKAAIDRDPTIRKTGR